MEEIQKFERVHGVCMPDDLKVYFGTVNGMRGDKRWEWDADMVSFWGLQSEAEAVDPEAPISHVAPLPAAWASADRSLRDLFVLGDWSLECFVFCVRMPAEPSPTSEVYYYDGDPPSRLAHSLQEFLERYLRLGIEGLYPD